VGLGILASDSFYNDALIVGINRADAATPEPSTAEPGPVHAGAGVEDVVDTDEVLAAAFVVVDGTGSGGADQSAEAL
jgi:hypothetical protein